MIFLAGAQAWQRPRRCAKRSASVRPADGHAFALELGRALEVRGVTLVTLQRRLADRGHRVSVGTLSYWRSGQRLPEKPASLNGFT